MSPEQILRLYFRAKDENRPFLLANVFSENATLEICNRSDQISFPPVTSGLAQIGDVLVRRFNQAYENIYSFYLDRPVSNADQFTCDWLVGMTEKETKNVRVGCGRYDWKFDRDSALLLATHLAITIDSMVVLAPSATRDVMRWLVKLSYPWSSAPEVTSALPLDELAPVARYLTRKVMTD